MQIRDDWEMEDGISGLKPKVIPGKNLDRLHIEPIEGRVPMNRDFWFTKDGEFDGTGSVMPEVAAAV